MEDITTGTLLNIIYKQSKIISKLKQMIETRDDVDYIWDDEGNIEIVIKKDYDEKDDDFII